MRRFKSGMSNSESFIMIGQLTGQEVTNSISESTLGTFSTCTNQSYLDLSSEETERWKNTLNSKKRSSLFSDVKTLEEDGCCSVAYEYLCRLEELRRYLSYMLNIELESFPVNLAFEHQLCNGVWLCQLLEEVLPVKDIGSKIYDTDHDTYKEEGLVYRHRQNICLFLDMIQELSFPDVLMPTPEEVFVNENRIKLVYTSAALAYFLRETELTNHKIDNLEKYLKFREPVLVEIMTMLESKALDLPSFGCLQALVDDELIYQKLKFDNTPLPSPSLQEKSYMTMKPSKHDGSSGDSDPENYYSNKTMDKGRGSKSYGPDGEPIYEDADKYIKSEIVTGDFQDSFDSPLDPFLSSTVVSPTKLGVDNNPRRRKLSKTRLHVVHAWGTHQLTMFPSRLEFNLFACKDNSMRVCMYTKPKIDMIIPTSPGKGMPLNIKPQLEKLKQCVLTENLAGLMDILSSNHFQLSCIDENNAGLYLEALKRELGDSLNKCALAIYYGMKKAQSEKYLAQSEQGCYLLRVGKKTPPGLSFSFRSKRGIKHFKIQCKNNKLSLKKRDVLRHEYNFVEDLIRELIDFFQDAHNLTMSSCINSELAINPSLKECAFFTSLSFDKVQFCIKAIHTHHEVDPLATVSAQRAPPKENPYTGLWGRDMIMPVDRFAAELLLLQYGPVGSYIVRPKAEGARTDYVISVRTENNVTHVKVVCGENGYSLPNSNETTSSLEQFVEVFTFKESQLTNIPLKPVRLPNEKVEELKKKDQERNDKGSPPPTYTPPATKKCTIKKGQSVEDLLKPVSSQFPHATMTTASNGYEGDIDTLDSVPPTPPPPFSPDMAFSPGNSTTEVSDHTVSLPNLSSCSEKSASSSSALDLSCTIPEEYILESHPILKDCLSSCPPQLSLSPPSPRKNLSQRVSAIHIPLPPVPTSSPILSTKLTESYPNTPPEASSYLINEYDHTTAPPVPLRCHALTKPTSEYDFKEIRRQQNDKSRKPRPLSIKTTSTIHEFHQPLPSSMSTVDFSSPSRMENDLSRLRKASMGSRPLNINPIKPTNRYHMEIERKISTSLFPTQPTLSVLEDAPTPIATPEPILEPEPVSEPEANRIDIDNWTLEEVGTWLEEIGLSQYKTTFADNDIDGCVLSMLTNENLKEEIGITSFGHRSKIIKQIKNLQK